MSKMKRGLLIILSSFFLLPYGTILDGKASAEDETNTHPSSISVKEDFADDSVLVVYKKESGKNLEDITAQDFPDVAVSSVKELTDGTKTEIHQKQEALIQKLQRASMHSASLTVNSQQILESEIDELEKLQNNYNQIVEITLADKSKQNVLETVKKLEKQDDVLIAQPNYLYTLCAMPNDPDAYQDSTSLLNLEKAWDVATGSSSVVVGVMDSGIDYKHPDLAGRIDVTLSRDFTGENKPLEDPCLDDYGNLMGHGTQVAGIIGAVGNNGLNISGVCWNVKIASLRVLNKYGRGNSSALVQAIDHARTKQIPILNISSAGYAYDSALKAQIDNFPGMIVCSSGNDSNNNDSSPIYPASYDSLNILSVGSTNYEDSMSDFSNYGKTSVDLMAPGEDTYTIAPHTVTTQSVAFNGTSASAPYVAGVAALIKSKYPDYTTSRIRTRILTGVDKNSSLTSKCVSGGRLNAYNALKTTANYFTVSYNANGGSGIMTDTRVYYGETTATKESAFSRSGYEFDCWYIKRSTDNKWRYRNPSNTSQTGWYTEGSQPSGWVKFPYSNATTVSTTTSTPGEIITFYAQWKKYFTVAYNANGGSGYMSSTRVIYGETTGTTSNTFTRAGYDFDCWFIKRSTDNKWRYRNPSNTSQTGWYTEGAQPSGWVKFPYSNGTTVSTTTSNPGETITFYAQWKKYFTVAYNANGGSGSMASTHVVYGVTTATRQNTFTRSGYTFNCWYIKRSTDNKWRYRNPNDTSKSGWYTEGAQPSGWVKFPYSNGTTVSTTTSNPGETITFYAQWKKT